MNGQTPVVLVSIVNLPAYALQLTFRATWLYFSVLLRRFFGRCTSSHWHLGKHAE